MPLRNRKIPVDNSKQHKILLSLTIYKISQNHEQGLFLRRTFILKYKTK